MDDINELRAALAQLEQDANSKIASLRQRIDELERQQSSADQDAGELSLDESVLQETAVSPEVSEPAPQPIPEAETEPSTPRSAQEAREQLRRERQGRPQRSQRPPRPQREATPLCPVVLAFLTNELGPVSTGINALIGQYESQRESGRSTQFVLVALGGLAVVSGIFYLLQYTFFSVFGDLARVGTGAAIGLAFIAVGSAAKQIRQQNVELANTLVAVGITVLYLTTYFAGFYYGVFGTTLTFSLFVLTTVVGLVLSALLGAPMLVIVTLVGGSLAPFAFEMQGIAIADFHLPSQAFLAVAVAVQAVRLRIRSVLQLSLAATAAIFEFHIVNSDVHTLSSLALVGALGAGFALLSILGKESWFIATPSPHPSLDFISSARVQVVVLNTLFVLSALYFLLSSVELGIAYAVGAALHAGLFWLVRGGAKAIAELSLTVAGVYVAFAALAVSGESFYITILGIEALLLLVFGFRHAFSGIRLESYVVLGGLLVLFAYSDPFGPLAGIGLLPLASLVAAFGATEFVLRRNSEGWIPVERHLLVAVELVSDVFFSLLLLCLVARIAPAYILSAAMLPGVLLLARGYFTNARYSHVIAIGVLALVPLSVLIGWAESGSFRFRHQTLATQVAIVQTAVLFWSMRWFYERTGVTGTRLLWASVLRTIVYLALPIFFLPKTFREFEQLLPLALWLSFGIAAVLATMLSGAYRERMVELEARALAVIAAAFVIVWSMSTFSVSLLMKTGYVMVSLVVLGLAPGFILRGRNAEDDDAFATFIRMLRFHFIAAAIFLAVAELASNPALGLAVVAVYYHLLIVSFPQVPHTRLVIKSARAMAWLAGTAAMSAAWLLEGWVTWLAAVLAIVTMMHMVYGRYQLKRFLARGIMRQAQVVNILVLIGYVGAAHAVTGDHFGAALTVAVVLHAVLLILLSLQKSQRESEKIGFIYLGVAVVKVLLVDLYQFSLVEKVMAFITIGVLLLAAAYLFQKIRDRLESEPGI